MARKRNQRTGHLREKCGSWLFQWRETVIGKDGRPVRKIFAKTIAPARGRDGLSKREAQRIAKVTILDKLDETEIRPSTLMTVAEFYKAHFEPEWVWTLRPSGKRHYKVTWEKIKLAMGDLRLKDVCSDDVQKLVRNIIDSGLSIQTARHAKNAVSAIFRHARAKGLFWGFNPVEGVRLPEMKLTRRRRALTALLVRGLLRVLRSPVREMVLLAIVTSMNVAELLGLRWGRVNLSAVSATADGELIPPYSLIVREQFYLGEFGPPKADSRNRSVPIPVAAIEALAALKQRPRFVGPDDLVFVSSKGTPLDADNLRSRHLKPAAEAIGLEKLGWHDLRRTYTTLGADVGMDLKDRQGTMGHLRIDMTAMYTQDSHERRRRGAEAILAAIMEGEPEAPKVLQ